MGRDYRKSRRRRKPFPYPARRLPFKAADLPGSSAEKLAGNDEL
jgi:hypothetical protein